MRNGQNSISKDFFAFSWNDFHEPQVFPYRIPYRGHTDLWHHTRTIQGTSSEFYVLGCLALKPWVKDKNRFSAKKSLHWSERATAEGTRLKMEWIISPGSFKETVSHRTRSGQQSVRGSPGPSMPASSALTRAQAGSCPAPGWDHKHWVLRTGRSPLWACVRPRLPSDTKTQGTPSARKVGLWGSAHWPGQWPRLLIHSHHKRRNTSSRAWHKQAFNLNGKLMRQQKI